MSKLLRSTRRVGRLAIGRFLGTRSVGRLTIGHLLSTYGIEARAVGRGLRVARCRFRLAQLRAALPGLTASSASWHCNACAACIDAALLNTHGLYYCEIVKKNSCMALAFKYMKRTAAELSDESGTPRGGGAAAAVAHEQAMSALGLGQTAPLVLARMYRDEPIRDIVRLCAVNQQLNATVCGTGARHREFWRLWGDEQREKDGMKQATIDFEQDAVNGDIRLLEYAYAAGIDTTDILKNVLEHVYMYYINYKHNPLKMLRLTRVFERLLRDADVSENVGIQKLLSQIIPTAIHFNDTELVTSILRHPEFILTNYVVSVAARSSYPLSAFIRHPHFASIYKNAYSYRELLLQILDSKNQQNFRDVIDTGLAPFRLETDPNMADPLVLALYNHQYDLFQYMLDSGRAGDPQEILNIVAQVSPGQYFHLYNGNQVQQYTHSIIAWLLRHGADVNASVRHDRQTALHIAARYNNVTATEALIKEGADVNALDAAGRTPLSYVDPMYSGVRQLLQNANA